MSFKAMRKARQRGGKVRAPQKLSKKPPKPKVRLTKRQRYALDFPYHSLSGRGLTLEHRRQMGLFETLLSVDLFVEFPEMAGNRPEWHASVSLVLGIVRKGPLAGMPMNPPLYSWGEDVWERCILECKTMLRGVGNGLGYWTGETCSLHYRKPLTDGEMKELDPSLLHNIKNL